MKTISLAVLGAALMCSTASAAAPSDSDVAWLKGCGVSQADVDVIAKLERAGQRKIRAILTLDDRECADVHPLIASRKFVLMFTPPPEKSPMPPAGYDNDYLTKAESDRINGINKAILDKAFANWP